MAVWFASPIDAFPHYYAKQFALVSATNADANFPATNLFDYDPTKVFRTTSGSTTVTVNISNPGGSAFFDVVSLIHTNASYRATWSVETSPDGTNWTMVASSRPLWANLTGLQPVSITSPTESTDPRRHSLERNHSLWVASALQTATHVRVNVLDPLVTNITLGRLFIGRRFVPTYGMQYGSTFHFTDFSKSERTDRGVQVLEAGKVITAASVKMDFLSKTEMYDYVYEFNRFLGSSRAFLACQDDVDTARLQKNLLYCTIAEGRMISFDSFNTHSTAWTLESIA
jgi:hypothetical protein